MLDLITGSLWPLIGGLVAILAPFVTLWLGKRQGRSQGKNEAQQEMQHDANKRVQEGRNRLRDNRGGDPDDRLRENDGRW